MTLPYHTLPPLNFLGLAPEDSGFDVSRVLVLPVPFEATTSYKGGTKDGPRAIIEASTQVELYDAELGIEPAVEWGIHTLPGLAPDLRGPEATVDAITLAVAELPCQTKLLAVLGGEHTISVGVARGLHTHFDDFVTVQLDAHADLRASYEGTPYSHACAARRISEFSEVIQIGIRSLDVSEAEFLREHPERVTAFFAHKIINDKSYLKTLVEKIAGRRVFLTMDLDVFDPSIMPATGTPEPGGLLWYDVLEIIRTVVSHSEVIAFDCVELSPIPGFHAPDFTAAKLVYKTLSLILSQTQGKSTS